MLQATQHPPQKPSRMKIPFDTFSLLMNKISMAYNTTLIRPPGIRNKSRDEKNKVLYRYRSTKLQASIANAHGHTLI